MHLAPDSREGACYSAEEVYEMLDSPPWRERMKQLAIECGAVDDHSRWGKITEDSHTEAVWKQRVIDAAEVISVQQAATGRGTLPAFAARLLRELRTPQRDWRALLQDFLQEEVCDYSFSPPDRRFCESSFFLPDYNETDYTASDIVYGGHVGSISDNMIAAAYSEICARGSVGGKRPECWDF